MRGHAEGFCFVEMLFRHNNNFIKIMFSLTPKVLFRAAVALKAVDCTG